jgi:NhaP-type Na+/H+ or K+/H+ antiporter
VCLSIDVRPFLELTIDLAFCRPTDPVLASSVVKGTYAERHVPPYIRHLLLIESGINDGSATSFFLAPLLLLTRSKGEAVKEWFLTGILWETLFAIVAGTAIGWIFRVALEQAKKREWVDKESSLVYTAALALLTTGVVSHGPSFEFHTDDPTKHGRWSPQLTYIDSNELLGCFCAGTALNWNDSIHTEDTHTHFSEAIDNVLDICVFLVLGTVLPWKAWGDKSSPFWIGKLVGFGFCVVFLRRLPSVLSLRRMIPMVRTGKEAMFVGHFGPVRQGLTLDLWSSTYSRRAFLDGNRGDLLCVSRRLPDNTRFRY